MVPVEVWHPQGPLRTKDSRVHVRQRHASWESLSVAPTGTTEDLRSMTLTERHALWELEEAHFSTNNIRTTR